MEKSKKNKVQGKGESLFLVKSVDGQNFVSSYPRLIDENSSTFVLVLM